MAPEKALYRRLRKIGLESHILKVSPDRRGHGGAHLIVNDYQAFLLALVRKGNFAFDSTAGRLLHLGTVSLRELRFKSGLHLAVKSDNSVDVHVDAVPPVIAMRWDGRCLYQPGRVARHFYHDLVPTVFHRYCGRRSNSCTRSMSRCGSRVLEPKVGEKGFVGPVPAPFYSFRPGDGPWVNTSILVR